MIDMRLHSGRFVSLGKEDSPSVTLYSKKKKKQHNKKQKKTLFQIYSSAYTPQNGTRARCRRWRGRAEQWSQRQGGEGDRPSRPGRACQGQPAGGRARGETPWGLLLGAGICGSPQNTTAAHPGPSPPSATRRRAMATVARAWRGLGAEGRAQGRWWWWQWWWWWWQRCPGRPHGCVQGAAGVDTGRAGGCRAVGLHSGGTWVIQLPDTPQPLPCQHPPGCTAVPACLCDPAAQPGIHRHSQPSVHTYTRTQTHMLRLAHTCTRTCTPSPMHTGSKLPRMRVLRCRWWRPSHAVAQTMGPLSARHLLVCRGPTPGTAAPRHPQPAALSPL